MSDASTVLLDDPWEVDASDFPKSGTTHEQLSFLVNYATLAPSILNTQPWSFRIEDETIVLRADRSRKLPITDPSGRELTISCGAALLNLRVAARSLGYDNAVRIFPDNARPDLMAGVSFLGGADPAQDAPLREAIAKRRTNRSGFEPREIPAELLSEMQEAARQEGCSMRFLTAADEKQHVAGIVVEAEDALLGNEAFRAEMSRWVDRRISAEQDNEAQQRLGLLGVGATGHTPGSRFPQDLVVPMATAAARAFPRLDEPAMARRDRIASTPVLGLLATKHDGPEAWIAAGQGLQRALLVAARDGASSGYLSAAVEVESLRPRIGEAFAVKDSPQVLLRLGYGGSIHPTPRRPVRDVID
jgi:nitroreductase